MAGHGQCLRWQIQGLSRVCPSPNFVQSLSRKPQVVNVWEMDKLTSPVFVQSLSKSKLCPIFIQKATSSQCAGDGQVGKSSVCPKFVQVQPLSKHCPGMPQAVNGRAMGELTNPGFVQSLSRSQVCPGYILSQKNPFSNALLDDVGTKIGFPSLQSVQWPQVWTGSLWTLDSDRTDLVLCMSLDRHLTELWQSLDKDWILCPNSVQPPFIKEHRIFQAFPNLSGLSRGPNGVTEKKPFWLVGVTNAIFSLPYFHLCSAKFAHDNDGFQGRIHLRQLCECASITLCSCTSSLPLWSIPFIAIFARVRYKYFMACCSVF